MSARLAFLGFGEAAQTFAGASNWSAQAVGYDIKLNDPVLGGAKCAEFKALGVADYHTRRAALEGAQVVLSLVTAAETLTAAQQAASHVRPGSLYVDMNSVAPMRKKAAAMIVEKAGAHYVDAAIMAPVQPAALEVPVLLSGPHADDAKSALSAIGFADVRIASARVGDASTIKMIRSVMIKGVEALTAECLLAADAAGVVDDVVASFGSHGGQQVNYNLDRMMVHGARRADELEEVCATLEALGIDPVLSQGAVDYHRSVACSADGGVPAALEDKIALMRQYRVSSADVARH